MVSPYEILEVNAKAREAVIRAAYRCLVQQYHPDRNQGCSAAGERLSLINRAYALLMDPLRRARYDQNAGIGVERRGSGRSSAPTWHAPGEGAMRMRPFAFRKLG